MPVHPYFNPDDWSQEVLPPQSLLLIIGVPFGSCLAVLGALLLSTGIPSLLLLGDFEKSPALALLRAYRAGHLISSSLALLAPFLYGALVVWLFRVWGHKLGRKTSLLSIPAFTILAGVLLLSVAAGAWGAVLWRAELPKLCVQYSADVRQIEAGELEHMTLLLDEKSTPHPMPGAPSDELTVHHRGASGPDTDFQWMTLRFPDALEFTPVPDSFVVIGGTYDWNWEHVQRYQVSYTSEFHLVVEITPVGGEEP